MEPVQKETVRPAAAVMRLAAYVSAPAPAASRNGKGILKLDSNESTIPPSPRVREKIQDFLLSARLHWYPDRDAVSLRRRLSEYTERPLSQIQAFSGSDGALQAIARTYLSPGDHVCIASPTYDHFRVFVEAVGADVSFVHGRSAFAPDLPALLRAIKPETRLVYVCNPNNPTGVTYSVRDVEHVLARLGEGLLVIDEAYYEFARTTMAGLLDRYDNLVVTRSFSKAFSLAGLRCGYLLASEGIVAHVDRIRNAKDLNSVAQVAAEAALDDLPYMNAYVGEVREAREWLTSELRKQGWPVAETPANFIMVESEDPARLVSRLGAQGIFVRDRSSVPQLEGYVRITVGTFEQSRQLLAAFPLRP